MYMESPSWIQCVFKHLNAYKSHEPKSMILLPGGHTYDLLLGGQEFEPTKYRRRFYFAHAVALP